MSVKLIYEDIGVGAQQDAEITTNDGKDFCQIALLPYGVDTPPISTLELNGWLLNGTRKLHRDQTIGFWSDQLSDENGVLDSCPVLTIDFDQQYTTLGISLIFDPATGDYCSDVTIRWYQGTSLLVEDQFSPNGVIYFCDRTVAHYNRLEIQLNKTHLPQHYAKLSRIIFGVLREFYRDELRDVQVSEAIHLISSEVSVNKLDFTLDSKTGVDYLFQTLQPVSAYDSDSLIGVFYIDKSTRNGKRLYSVYCNDAIGVLDYETLPAKIYQGMPARQALEHVLDGKFDLDLAPELESESITGYLAEMSRRSALHQMAFSMRAVVDTSGTDKIRVYRVSIAAPVQIPEGRCYTGGSLDIGKLVTAVSVTAHSYSTSGSGYDAVEVDGVTYYHTTAVYTIKNPDVTVSDKQNVVEIQDATLVHPGILAAVAQNAYQYYLRRRTLRQKIIVQGERPGDPVSIQSPWHDPMSGHITTMHMTLSGITAADCEVLGP